MEQEHDEKETAEPLADVQGASGGGALTLRYVAEQFDQRQLRLQRLGAQARDDRHGDDCYRNR